MKITLVHGNKILDLDESTPQEQKKFYESIIISKEQARAFAFDIWHSETFHKFWEERK